MRALARIDGKEALSRLAGRWRESEGGGVLRLRLRHAIEDFPVRTADDLAAKREALAATSPRHQEPVQRTPGPAEKEEDHHRSR